MRTIDIIPTALGILGKGTDIGDGQDVRANAPNCGENFMDDIKGKYNTIWKFNGEEWNPTLTSKIQIQLQTAIGDLKKSAYRRGYKPLKENLKTKTTDDVSGIVI